MNMTMKVAIIEDEKPNARMLTGMLQDLRPEWELVARLESVRQSVAFFRSGGQPDLVLMDIQLPVISGTDLTRRIRQGQVPGCDPALPVIAMTAYAMRGDRDRFLAAGIDDYVSKPVDVATLQAALARATKAGKPEDGASGGCIRYT